MKIEKNGGNSWIVDLGNLNWQFLHLEAEGGASTLENHIRNVVQEVTGDWEFRVVLVGATRINYEVVG